MPGRLAPPAALGPAARAWLLGTTALLPVAFLLGAAGEARAQLLPAPNAGPTGGQVVAGSAAIAQTPRLTQITQSTDRAAINWQQFNVGSAHHVDFRQPSAASWTLNRVTGPDPSVIAGRVTANGGVALVNSSGVVFADGAQVNVGSLIASASNITNENFMAGRMAFDGAPRPGARVENRGRVTVRERGLAALVAPEVRNSGVIRARLGRVALAGAEAFTLDLAGDGLVSIDVTQAVRQAPEGGAAALVTNSGVVRAEGGSVLLTAHAASGLVETLVSNGGRIAAPTVAATPADAAPERAGTVALRAEGGGVRVENGGRVSARGGRNARGGAVEVNASGSATLAAGAVVDVSGGAGGGRATIGTALTSSPGQPVRPAARTEIASGATVRANATRRGRGGTVLVNSTESTVHRGRIEARGGPQGGDGGFVELSGRGAMQVAGVVDVAAPAGRAGELFLDPQRIRVTDDFASNDDLVLPPDAGGNVFATTAPDTGEVLVRPGTIESFNGTVTLAADLGVRITSEIDKPNGGLTLQTLQPATAPGLSGISIEAPITLGAGTLTATTAGSIYVGAPVAASNVALTGGFYIDLFAPISAPGGAVTLNATAGSIYQGTDAAITAATLVASAPLGSVHLDSGFYSSEGGGFGVPNRVGTLLGGVAADTYYLYNAGPLTVGGAVEAGGELVVTNLGSVIIAPAGSLTGGGAPFAGIGVMVDATGFIRNEGSITGTASSAFNGVQLHAGTGIVNLGSITGTGGGDLDPVTGEIIRAVSLAAGGAVANEGTIRGPAGASTDGGGVGINGLNVINRAAGSIEGPLVFLRTTGDITNAGTIRGTGALSFAAGPSYGLWLDAGGAIANSGLVETTTARALLNAGSSITNAATGRILGVGLGTSGDAATGVMATAGSFLRNLGTIQGSNTGFFSWAVDLAAGSAIDNRGLILGVAGGPDGDGSVRLNAATGIDNRAGGRIESAGQFGYLWLDAGGDIDNAGSIASTDWISISAGGALRNSGAITAPGSIYISVDGELTNTATGSILAAGDYAWVDVFATGALRNAGRIEAHGFDASVYVSSDDAIANSGTIASRLGGATDASGISTFVSAETSLTNSGTIASDGVTTARALGGDVTNSGSIASAAAYYYSGNDSIPGAPAPAFIGGPDPDYSAAYTRVEASGAVINTGTIAAPGTGTTPSGAFFAADAEILAGAEIRNSGSIAAAGNVHASAGSFLDTSGTIEALLGEVRLHAAGLGLPAGQDWAIRQTAGTIRAPGTGTAFDSTPGLVDLQADAGGVLQAAAAGAIEAHLLTGNVAGAVSLESPANLVEALGTFRAGTAATTPDQARFTLRTGSPQLAVGGEVSVGVFDNDGTLVVVQRGGTIGLAADDLAIAPQAGLLRAPDGTVAITPHTAGTHIALARRDPPAGTGSELALDRAELEDGIRADRLVLGAGPDGTTAFPRAGSIRQYADGIDFRTGENQPAAGTAPGVEGRPRTLELYATGAIQQRGRSGDPAAETEGRGPDAADGTRGALRVGNLGGEAGSFAWFGADNGVLHLDGFLAGETVTLRNAPGESLGIANPVRVGAGGRITLATDALAFENDIQGMLSAPGGVIEILPVTAGRRVVFQTGAADPSALSLDTIGLALVGETAAPTAVLRIGRSEDTAVTGNAAWPVGFGIGRSEVPVGDAGAAGPGPRTAGDIDFAAALSLRSGAVARVGRLELFAGTEGTATGTITQAPGAGIDVAVLAGESRRAALLDAPGNRIDTLAGFRAGMGATTAGQAEFRLASRLDGGAGGADADQPLAVTGEVSVGVRGDGSIAREDGRIDLAAPGLALQADLTAPPAADPAASSQVRLEATTGDIIQSGTGRILTGELFAQSARDTLLDAGPNAVQTLLAIDPLTGLLAPRDFRLRVVTPITLSGALTAGRDLGIASDADLGVAAGAQVTAGQDLTLDAGTDLAIAATASLAAPGLVALNAGGSIAHAGGITAGAIDATALADLDIAAGASMTATDSVVLFAGNSVSHAGSIAGGSIDVTANAGDFSAAAGSAMSASGAVSVMAEGNATVLGSIGGGSIEIQNLGGDLTLGGGSSLVAPGEVRLLASGAFQGDGAINGGIVTIASGTHLGFGSLASVSSPYQVTLSAQTFTNAGTITTGYFTANAGAGVSNTGSITGGATTGGPEAVRISAGTTLDNSGTITGAGGDDATAAVLLRSVGALSNTGSIRGVATTTPGSGGVRLDSTGSTIINAGTVEAAGGLVAIAGTGFATTGSLAGGSIDVTAGTDLAIAAGATVMSGQGAVTLAAGGAVSHAGTIFGVGGIDVTAGTDLVIAAGSTTTATGVVALRSNGNTVALGSIDGGGGIRLLAGADIDLGSASNLTTSASLMLAAGGGIAGNGSIFGASVAITSGLGLDLGAGADLRAVVGMTLGTGTGFANAGTISAGGGVTATAGTSFANTGSIAGGHAGFSGEAVRVVAGTTLDNTGAIAGTGGDANTAAVLLRSGATLSNAGSINGLTSGVAGSGGVRLDSTTGVIANAGTVEAEGALTVTADAGIANAGSLAGGLAGGAGTAVLAVTGSGDLHNTGSITGTGGSATAPGVSLSAGGGTGRIINDGSIAAIGSGANQGSLVLDAAGGVRNAGTLTGAHDVRVTAGTAIDNAGTIEARIGRVALTARGVGLPAGQTWSIRQTGTVTAPANTAPGAASPDAGDVAIRAEAGDVVFGTGSIVAGQRDVRIEALTGGVTADGATLTAGRAMRIEAGTSVAQRGGLIEGETLLARAFDSVTLDAADTAARQGARIQALTGAVAVTGGGALTAGRELRIEAGHAIQLAGGLLAGETLVARTGGVLRLDGVHFVLGTGALFAAHGGIEAGAMSLVTPHDPAALPALLFDTRAVTYAAIPGFVQPDVPGLAPEAQATQVRLFGQEAPGDFGPASNHPAGPIQLHLDAGSSPVFLLLDGGVASGGLAAGRLGVHGQGGAADLTGMIGGRADESAALTPGAEITRPITTAERWHYRFNGCVIGSVRCTSGLDEPEETLIERVPVLPNVVNEVGSEAATAAANISRLFIPETPLVRIRRLRDRLADPDVLLPNTVEEDY